jgi:uncharacterized protein
MRVVPSFSVASLYHLRRKFKMRASSYNIYVNLPNTKDETLLVHGYTGAYDRVSRRVADYVRSLEGGKRAKPLWGKWSDEEPVASTAYVPSEKTLLTLKKRGYLTEKSFEEEQAMFSRIANRLQAEQNRPSYILMPTYNCNLRCPYCFQDHMRTDPAYAHLLRTMSFDMADRILSALPKIERYHNVAPETDFTRSIGFFGGEPLMQASRPVIEHIINRAQELGKTNFYAITNGTDLEFFKDLLSPEKIGFLQITLDGPAREHDKRRIYANGDGSFERIARNIGMVLDLGVTVSVRMNVDRNNIGLLPELADEIVARGWESYKNFSAYTAPVHAANDNVETKTTFNSWQLDKAIDELRENVPNMRVIQRPDDGMKERARRLFVKSGAPALRSTFCGAHNGMYIFDAFGDIYACWERTGDQKIRIGSLHDAEGFTLNDELNAMWRSRNVTTNPTCLKCRYALNCGGGCAVYAEAHNGTMFSNFCDAYAKRFNVNVAEAYLEHVGGVEYVEKADRACDL